MAAFAEAGYLAIVPNHNDAICGGGLSAFLSARPEESFRDPGSWSDKTYRDRNDDISKLVDAHRRDSKWSNQIDWSRVALAGHSLGGYTVLGLAGSDVHRKTHCHINARRCADTLRTATAVNHTNESQMSGPNHRSGIQTGPLPTLRRHDHLALLCVPSGSGSANAFR